MIIITTAFLIEAKPIILNYGLKKDTQVVNFQIYRNNDIILGISGIGKINSAIFTTQILSSFKNFDNVTVINLGIAGCYDKEVDIGSLLLINKIIDVACAKNYYPDILLKHALTEKVIETHDQPVILKQKDIPKNSKNNLVDMEVSGFFQAATNFLPPERIHCLKIVSDHLDTIDLDKEKTALLISQKIDAIENFISSTQNLVTVEKCKFSDDENNIINKIKEHLKLTVTQKIQLDDWLNINFIHGKKSLKELDTFLQKPVKTKFERNNIFSEIKNELLAK